MTTTHAQLSPSKAYRYLACPGSIREEAAYPVPGCRGFEAGVIVDALVKKPWVDTSRWLYDLHMVGKLIDYQMIGSTYTLGTGRDIDFAVLMPETFSLLDQPEWLGEGWVREGSDHYEGGAIASHRKGDTNIIVMNDCDLYQKFLTAMEVCKVLKLKTRKERVLVCRIVRDGMSAEQADSLDIPGEQK